MITVIQINGGSMMKCQQCGCENNDNMLFCSECGKALKEQPIELDLQQIKIPAGARKARIVKVNAKKSEHPAQEPAAETNPPQVAENKESPDVEATPQTNQTADEQPQQAQQEKSASSPLDTQEKTQVQNKPQPTEDPTCVPMKKRNWLAVFILCAIPCVNLIMLLIWSFSSRTNKSKKSYAQMTLILMLIGIVLAVAAAFTAVYVFGFDYNKIAQLIQMN